MTSLRGRVLWGAVLWTLGLIAILGLSFPLLVSQLKSDDRPHVITFTWSPAFSLHTTALVALAAGCMIAGLAVVRRALVPFQNIRARLAEVRKGDEHRLPGAYPSEVQPLVDDLNGLLEHNEQVVARAIAKAGDLAHGLKTPLAVLAHEAERAEASGQRELAETIRHQVDRMRRQVDYHLAHARAAAAGSSLGARSSLAASAEGLARTLRRLHADRELAIRVEVAPEHSFRGQREDLDEMLGNILDNACKWARASVTIASAETGDRVVVTVDDDGPGLAPSLRDRVLQRGVRADEAAPGSGLGLAIVRDLAELYGGSISLASSSSGGLRARLELPAG